jgi:hypothetical protein
MEEKLDDIVNYCQSCVISIGSVTFSVTPETLLTQEIIEVSFRDFQYQSFAYFVISVSTPTSDQDKNCPRVTHKQRHAVGSHYSKGPGTPRYVEHASSCPAIRISVVISRG